MCECHTRFLTYYWINFKVRSYILHTSACTKKRKIRNTQYCNRNNSVRNKWHIHEKKYLLYINCTETITYTSSTFQYHMKINNVLMSFILFKNLIKSFLKSFVHIPIEFYVLHIISNRSPILHTLTKLIMDSTTL